MTTEEFTAHWLGNCPVAGCKTVLHFDVPMIRERWAQTHHDHAHRTSWQVNKSRDREVNPNVRIAAQDCFCIAHKRRLVWKPVNGRFVEGHVCDARCMNARGWKCDCSCGGANHGRGFHVELRFQ